ncbi:MAG: 2-amino-4-hydroxy-6-hydroxymethyldihydropteridine diphosphokinase [Candidatus Sumerlaeota bacterium]|nr:2-amino-4-hydroxy-6-hydroxymethyldihydropteridine diphosphokinase [Candidatus Sumerlaeota bacterium]
MARVFISVGSNIAPEQNVRGALRLLAARAPIVAVSTVYRVAAINRPGQPPYLNCVVEVETDIPPLEFKRAVLRKIEKALGRTRGEDKYAPRTIDLDLILHGDQTLETAELALPSPDILVRLFLAIPLAELAPDLALPGSGARIGDVAESMPRQGMEALNDFTESLREDLRLM